MRGAWICGTCRNVVRNPWDRFERRTEYRDVKKAGRYHVRLDAHLCRTCVDAEIAAEKPPVSAIPESLF